MSSDSHWVTIYATIPRQLCRFPKKYIEMGLKMAIYALLGAGQICCRQGSHTPDTRPFFSRIPSLSPSGFHSLFAHLMLELPSRCPRHLPDPTLRAHWCAHISFTDCRFDYVSGHCPLAWKLKFAQRLSPHPEEHPDSPTACPLAVYS